MYHAHTLQDTGPDEERILVEPEATVHAAGAKSGAPPGPRASAALGASSKPAGPPCALAQTMQFNSFNFETFQYHQITLK